MDDNAHYLLDSLDLLEDKISTETKISLVHIAGYVTRKDIIPSLEHSCHIFTHVSIRVYTEYLL